MGQREFVTALVRIAWQVSKYVRTSVRRKDTKAIAPLRRSYTSASVLQCLRVRVWLGRPGIAELCSVQAIVCDTLALTY